MFPPPSCHGDMDDQNIHNSAMLCLQTNIKQPHEYNVYPGDIFSANKEYLENVNAQNPASIFTLCTTVPPFLP